MKQTAFMPLRFTTIQYHNVSKGKFGRLSHKHGSKFLEPFFLSLSHRCSTFFLYWWISSNWLCAIPILALNTFFPLRQFWSVVQLPYIFFCFLRHRLIALFFPLFSLCFSIVLVNHLPSVNRLLYVANIQGRCRQRSLDGMQSPICCPCETCCSMGKAHAVS